MSAVRIILADDHPVVLAGVRALLQSSSDYLVVGEATSGAAALDLICHLKPDVAVFDISMPDLSGVALAEQAAERCPDVKLLALTVHEDRAYVQRLLQLGVRGYLLKRTAAEDLIHAIRAVASGGIYVDPSVAGKVLPVSSKQASSSSRPASPEDLSPRETEVLRLTALGYSNKEIASRLEISVKSVETYKARAAGKLDLRTRSDIVRYGAAQGWIAGLE